MSTESFDFHLNFDLWGGGVLPLCSPILGPLIWQWFPSPRQHASQLANTLFVVCGNSAVEI